MSKKKNKFKKKKHHQQNIVAPQIESVKIASQENEPAKEIENNSPTPALPEIPKEHESYSSDKYAHVKTDIKKILIIMAIIFLILIGIYILSFKTTFLNTFGDWVYKILNIQTG